MFDFVVYSNGERIGLLQNYTSVQWLEDYADAGEVKIVAYATPENMELLVEGNRIYNKEHRTVAQIKEVELSQSDGIGTLSVRAVLTAQLLDDRVVMATEKITNLEKGMYDIYNKNRRGLPIESAPQKGLDAIAETEVSWTSVLEGCKTLAQSGGLGFRVVFDPVTTTETFEVYKGVDRSVPGSDTYVGYLGTDVDNLSDFRIVKNDDFKNTAIVAGEENEDEDRVIVTVSLGDFQGEQRREMFVDAKGTKKKYKKSIDTGQIDQNGNPVYEYEDAEYAPAEYKAVLRQQGIEKLLEEENGLELSAEAIQQFIVFGRDYYLGDIVPVKLTEYGFFATARVTSVNTIYESTGQEYIVTLSNITLLSDPDVDDSFENHLFHSGVEKVPWTQTTVTPYPGTGSIYNDGESYVIDCTSVSGAMAIITDTKINLTGYNNLHFLLKNTGSNVTVPYVSSNRSLTIDGNGYPQNAIIYNYSVGQKTAPQVLTLDIRSINTEVYIGIMSIIGKNIITEIYLEPESKIQK